MSSASTWDRLAAAAELSSSGDDSGVPEIIAAAEEGKPSSLLALHGLRSPSAWKKLQQTTVGRDCRGTRLDLLRSLADTSQMSLVLAPEAEILLADTRQPVKIRAYGGRQSVADALPLCLPSTLDVLVESETIRVVPKNEALATWKSWWSARKQR
jgi:hypothetical protein